MLCKIHKYIRITNPQGLNRNGEARKSYLSLRGPAGSSINVYGGNAGDAGLKELVERLIAMVPEKQVGSMYIHLDGIRPTDNGLGFVGFASDLTPMPASESALAWAAAKDDEFMRRSLDVQTDIRLEQVQVRATDVKASVEESVVAWPPAPTSFPI
jgi:hypothetical protein